MNREQLIARRRLRLALTQLYLAKVEVYRAIRRTEEAIYPQLPMSLRKQAE